jgi:DNA-binding CsgD family transcriptional regulator
LEDARLAPRVADHAIVLERIGQRNRGFPRSLGRFNLTERERKIASLLIAGFTSKELARRMNIRERQVKTYSRSIVAKLGGTA